MVTEAQVLLLLLRYTPSEANTKIQLEAIKYFGNCNFLSPKFTGP